MKKLEKLSLKRLEEEMPLMTEKMLTGIMGGYDPNDCMWRCFAYLDSCGTSYGSYEAESLASTYYGSSFDSTDYGFGGTSGDANALGGNVLGTEWDDPTRNFIIVFNPNDFSNWQGNTSSSHAVICTGESADCYYTFDPQAGQSGEISKNEYVNSTSTKYLL